MEVEKQVQNLRLEDVLPNRFQPRIKFSEESINELANSIKEHGVIQPIVVRRIGDKYEIIAGERRYKASHIAGKETIPAIISDLGDSDSAEIALLENVQRENLTPIEEAISYKKILDMGYTQEQLAKKIGNKQSTIANKVRLLNLTDEVQEALLENKISERHARSLLKISDSELQVIMLDRIIQGRYTVRKTDEEIDKLLKGELDMSENNEVLTTIPTSKIYEEETPVKVVDFKADEEKVIPLKVEVPVAPVPVETIEKTEPLPVSMPEPVKDTPFDTKFLEKETFVNMPMHSIPTTQPLSENSEYKDGKYFELPKQEKEYKVDNTFNDVFGETNEVSIKEEKVEEKPVMPTFEFTEPSPLDDIETVSFGEEEISMPSFTSPLAGLPDIEDLEQITANIPTLEEMNNYLKNQNKDDAAITIPTLTENNVALEETRVEPTLEEVETITPLKEEEPVINMPSLSIIDEAKEELNVEPILFDTNTLDVSPVIEEVKTEEVSTPVVNVEKPVEQPTIEPVKIEEFVESEKPVVTNDIPVITIPTINRKKEEPVVLGTTLEEKVELPVVEEQVVMPTITLEEPKAEEIPMPTFENIALETPVSVVEEVVLPESTPEVEESVETPVEPAIEAVVTQVEPEQPILKEYTIPTFDPEFGSSTVVMNEDIKPVLMEEENKEEVKEEKVEDTVIASDIKLPLDVDTINVLRDEFLNTLKDKGFNVTVENMDLEGNLKLIFTIEK